MDNRDLRLKTRHAGLPFTTSKKPPNNTPNTTSCFHVLDGALHILPMPLLAFSLLGDGAKHTRRKRGPHWNGGGGVRGGGGGNKSIYYYYGMCNSMCAL